MRGSLGRVAAKPQARRTAVGFWAAGRPGRLRVIVGVEPHVFDRQVGGPEADRAGAFAEGELDRRVALVS